MAELLHGHLHEALRRNALTTLLVPVAAAYALEAYVSYLARRPPRVPPIPAIYATLAVAILFTVTRNL